MTEAVAAVADEAAVFADSEFLKELVKVWRAQDSQGHWDESMGEGPTKQGIITGTGYPRVYYLAYTLYRDYFPLLALTTYKRAMERAA